MEGSSLDRFWYDKKDKFSKYYHKVRSIYVIGVENINRSARKNFPTTPGTKPDNMSYATYWGLKDVEDFGTEEREEA